MDALSALTPAPTWDAGALESSGAGFVEEILDQLTETGSMFDHAAAGIAWFDADDVLRYANRWFESSYNVRAADHPSWEDMMRNCHATQTSCCPAGSCLRRRCWVWVGC